jgi:HEAT repeat protein
MSDAGLEPTNYIDSDERESELGEVRLGEDLTFDTASEPILPAKAGLMAVTPATQKPQGRAGNVEHLAVRHPVPALDVNTPEVKQRLSELRTEMTTLVTDLRWGGVSVKDTVAGVIPLLDVGPVQQWASQLVATLLEIDRAGNLIPVWLKVIQEDDTTDLPPNANPAETTPGRARRYAILMLGNYKSPELSETLGKLAADGNSSLYATQSLAKQATTASLQALISALTEAEGWAKVDIIETCVTLNRPSFQELLLASGLDRALGLESYIAVPLYRTIALERYIRGEQEIAPRLSQQAVMIAAQVFQDSLSTTNADTLPIAFERDLPALATALFESARSTPNWRKVIAVHRLAMLLGRYWADISRGVVQDSRIVQPVYACLPMMPEVERWMNGPGRDVLLETLANADEESLVPCVKVLGELREPRALAMLTARLDAVSRITDREQALRLASICETLGRLGDQRATGSLLQFASRSIDLASRSSRSKRRDNLDAGDTDIAGSIVYAAVIRALAELRDPNALDFIIRAASDFDPYVRTQAFEALRRIDPTGQDVRSRMLVREALSDPRDSVVRIACQLTAQYHDVDAASSLRQLAEARPEFAAPAYDALRQLGIA